jgi:uncharacterized membrane protein
MRRWLAAVMVLAAGLAAAGPAEAALKLCNRTSYILYAATVSVTKTGSTIHGWTRIAPGDCRTALPQKLKAQSYLVYARSALAYSGPERVWGGSVPLCVKDPQFTLYQKTAASPCLDDFYAVPFAEVNTHGQPDWTMTFDDDPPLKTLEAAQLAGVKRLLKDNGYDIPSIDAKPDKPTGAALADFRGKMRFPSRAGNAELFAALETQAARHEGKPQGYTVCNDAKADLTAALAERSGPDFVSRGWWRLAAGGCARMITSPLKSDAVWLLVQKPGGVPLVSGADEFCIAAKAFEIKGRAGCSGRGFSQAGFARMPVRGKSGMLVRIDAKGLVKSQDEIPK